MKNRLWFLGICVVFVTACQERSSDREKEAFDSLVDDTPQNLEVVQAVDSQRNQHNYEPHPKVIAVSKTPQDTQERYPIIHIGDKDFNPNRYLGPNATESQRNYALKMIARDSLKRAASLDKLKEYNTHEDKILDSLKQLKKEAYRKQGLKGAK